MPRKKGLYIAFEGGEGGGKSTQAQLLKDALGENAIRTFEPGATDLGVELRRILLDPSVEQLGPMAEAYLMAADRSDNMDKIVRPGLRNGKTVISDRTFISSIAYQGAGRELGVEQMLNLNLMNKGLVLPDIVIIMATPSKELLRERLKEKPDKLEAAGDEFHQKVAECFGQMANILSADSRTVGISIVTLEPESCGQPKSPEEVHREVLAEIEDYCKESGVACPI